VVIVKYMRNPLHVAMEKGWKMNSPGEDGIVEFAAATDGKISYPKELYEQDDSDNGYWVKHRSEEILWELNRIGLSQIVEVGAGTGSVCGFLVRNGIQAVAIEPLKAGAKIIQDKGVQTICGQLEAVSFPEDSIETYGVFDVLEHLENPSQILQEMYRTLKPGGYLFVTVPCGHWLWGHMDESLGHFRRYSRKGIDQLVAKSGFESIGSRYLFLSLVVPAFVFRAVPYRLGIRKSESNALQTVQREQRSNAFLNKIMKVVFKVESIASRKLWLPYGLSVFAIYTKQLRED
jgi:SAM-dependent methyltransferase